MIRRDARPDPPTVPPPHHRRPAADRRPRRRRGRRRRLRDRVPRGAGRLRTVVLDARPRPATLTTPAATGAFRLQFDNAEEVALVREGIELYEDFADRGRAARLRHRTASRRATSSAPATTRARRASASSSPGSAAFGLDRRRAARRRRGPAALPVRRRHGPPGAVPGRRRVHRSGPAGLGLRPRGVRPGRASSGRPAAARRRSSSASVSTRLRVVGGRIVAVETHDGAIAAPLVVLATGPFLGRTAALAGVDVPIAPTRRQKVVVPDAPEVPQDAPMTIDETTGAHWRPALRGAYVLLTEPGTPADRSGLERPDVGRLRLPAPRSRRRPTRRPRRAVLGRRLGARRRPG